MELLRVPVLHAEVVPAQATHFVFIEVRAAQRGVLTSAGVVGDTIGQSVPCAASPIPTSGGEGLCITVHDQECVRFVAASGTISTTNRGLHTNAPG